MLVDFNEDFYVSFWSESGINQRLKSGYIYTFQFNETTTTKLIIYSHVKDNDEIKIYLKFESNDNSKTLGIVLAVIGGLLVIAIIASLLIVWKKKMWCFAKDENKNRRLLDDAEDDTETQLEGADTTSFVSQTQKKGRDSDDHY